MKGDNITEADIIGIILPYSGTCIYEPVYQGLK